MAHLLVIGASRGIGLAAVRAGLAAGHRVRGLSRRAAQIAIDDPAFEPAPGDATDSDTVAAALDGIDAVIFALGVPKSLDRTLRPLTTFSDATRATIAAMERGGVRRLVAVTGFGAGESRQAMSVIERVPHRILLGHAYDDKDRQEALIRDSTLDWLILRPTILTNRPARGDVKLLRDRATWRNGLISRADVAEVLVREAARPTLSFEAPVLTT